MACALACPSNRRCGSEALKEGWQQLGTDSMASFLPNGSRVAESRNNIGSTLDRRHTVAPELAHGGGAVAQSGPRPGHCCRLYSSNWPPLSADGGADVVLGGPGDRRAEVGRPVPGVLWTVGSAGGMELTPVLEEGQKEAGESPWNARHDSRPPSRHDSSPPSRHDSGPPSRHDSGPPSRCDPSPPSRRDSGPLSRRDSDPQSRHGSGLSSRHELDLLSMHDSGPPSRNDSGPQSRNDSGPQSRHDLGPSSRRDSSPPSRLDSGPPSRHDSDPPSRHGSGLPSKHDSDLPSRHDLGPPSRLDLVPPSRHDSGSASRHNSGPPSRHDSGPPSRHGSGPPSRHDSGPPSRHDSGPPSRHDSGPPSRHDSGPPSRHDSGPLSRHDSGLTSRHDSALQVVSDGHGAVTFGRERGVTSNMETAERYARTPVKQLLALGTPKYKWDALRSAMEGLQGRTGSRALPPPSSAMEQAHSETRALQAEVGGRAGSVECDTAAAGPSHRGDWNTVHTLLGAEMKSRASPEGRQGTDPVETTPCPCCCCRGCNGGEVTKSPCSRPKEQPSMAGSGSGVAVVPEQLWNSKGVKGLRGGPEGSSSSLVVFVAQGAPEPGREPTPEAGRSPTHESAPAKSRGTGQVDAQPGSLKKAKPKVAVPGRISIPPWLSHEVKEGSGKDNPLKEVAAGENKVSDVKADLEDAAQTHSLSSQAKPHAQNMRLMKKTLAREPPPATSPHAQDCSRVEHTLATGPHHADPKHVPARNSEESMPPICTQGKLPPKQGSPQGQGAARGEKKKKKKKRREKSHSPSTDSQHCLCCPLHPSHSNSMLYSDYLYLLRMHNFYVGRFDSLPPSWARMNQTGAKTSVQTPHTNDTAHSVPHPHATPAAQKGKAEGAFPNLSTPSIPSLSSFASTAAPSKAPDKTDPSVASGVSGTSKALRSFKTLSNFLRKKMQGQSSGSAASSQEKLVPEKDGNSHRGNMAAKLCQTLEAQRQGDSDLGTGRCASPPLAGWGHSASTQFSTSGQYVSPEFKKAAEKFINVLSQQRAEEEEDKAPCVEPPYTHDPPATERSGEGREKGGGSAEKTEEDLTPPPQGDPITGPSRLNKLDISLQCTKYTRQKRHRREIFTRKVSRETLDQLRKSGDGIYLGNGVFAARVKSIPVALLDSIQGEHDQDQQLSVVLAREMSRQRPARNILVCHKQLQTEDKLFDTWVAKDGPRDAEPTAVSLEKASTAVLREEIPPEKQTAVSPVEAPAAVGHENSLQEEQMVVWKEKTPPEDPIQGLKSTCSEANIREASRSYFIRMRRYFRRVKRLSGQLHQLYTSSLAQDHQDPSHQDSQVPESSDWKNRPPRPALAKPKQNFKMSSTDSTVQSLPDDVSSESHKWRSIFFSPRSQSCLLNRKTSESSTLFQKKPCDQVSEFSLPGLRFEQSRVMATSAPNSPSPRSNRAFLLRAMRGKAALYQEPIPLFARKRHRNWPQTQVVGPAATAMTSPSPPRSLAKNGQFVLPVMISPVTAGSVIAKAGSLTSVSGMSSLSDKHTRSKSFQSAAHARDPSPSVSRSADAGHGVADEQLSAPVSSPQFPLVKIESPSSEYSWVVSRSPSPQRHKVHRSLSQLSLLRCDSPSPQQCVEPRWQSPSHIPIPTAKPLCYTPESEERCPKYLLGARPQTPGVSGVAKLRSLKQTPPSQEQPAVSITSSKLAMDSPTSRSPRDVLRGFSSGPGSMSRPEWADGWEASLKHAANVSLMSASLSLASVSMSSASIPATKGRLLTEKWMTQGNRQRSLSVSPPPTFVSRFSRASRLPSPGPHAMSNKSGHSQMFPSSPSGKTTAAKPGSGQTVPPFRSLFPFRSSPPFKSLFPFRSSPPFKPVERRSRSPVYLRKSPLGPSPTVAGPGVHTSRSPGRLGKMSGREAQAACHLPASNTPSETPSAKSAAGSPKSKIPKRVAGAMLGHVSMSRLRSQSRTPPRTSSSMSPEVGSVPRSARTPSLLPVARSSIPRSKPSSVQARGPPLNRSVPSVHAPTCKEQPGPEKTQLQNMLKTENSRLLPKNLAAEQHSEAVRNELWWEKHQGRSNKGWLPDSWGHSSSGDGSPSHQSSSGSKRELQNTDHKSRISFSTSAASRDKTHSASEESLAYSETLLYDCYK